MATLSPFSKNNTVHVDPFCECAGVGSELESFYNFTRPNYFDRSIETNTILPPSLVFERHNLYSSEYQVKDDAQTILALYDGNKQNNATVHEAFPRNLLQKTLPGDGPTPAIVAPVTAVAEGQTAPAAQRRQSRRLRGLGPEQVGGNAGVFGAPNLDRRLVNPGETEDDKVLRKAMYTRVGEACNFMWRSDVPLAFRNGMDNKKLNSLFLHMKDFLFHDAMQHLEEPRGWERGHRPQSKTKQHGQFDDVVIRLKKQTIVLQRMLLQNFNPPALKYTVEGIAKIQSRSEGVLVRTLHRLINDDVMMHFFIVPDVQRDPATFIEGSETITTQRFAERFLHLSQRTYWTGVMLRYARNNLEDNISKLRSQLQAWVQND